MAQSSVLEWANTIRYTMANDSGRQYFQHQIQTHGFSFLDDYLENIISGPTQEPIIELVKTPGRKKIAKKVNTVSKLNNVLTLSLEDDTPLKENVAPMNDFHQNLLQLAKTDSAQSGFGEANSQTPTHPRDILRIPPFATLPTIALSSAKLPATADGPSSTASNTLLTPSFLEPIHNEPELSVIAEDEESPARTLRGPGPPTPIAPQPSAESRMTESPPPRNSHHRNAASVSSNDTFHSMPLDSPRDLSPQQELPQPVVSSVIAREVTVVPAESSVANTMPEPPAPPESADIVMSTEVPLTTQTAVPVYPTLPGPLPFRKSMRAPRDQVVPSGSNTAVTPGAGLNGKRTSWLMKAREVKALENTAKFPIAFMAGNAGTKRKSGDLLALQSSDEERHQKTSKHTESDTAVSTPGLPLSFASPAQADVDMASSPAGGTTLKEQEGMLDRLKRTVEGLGARVGKSMGMSLSATAAHAVAEAKAAAELRVVGRKQPEVEALPVQTALSAERKVDTVNPPGIFSLPRMESRLSVSDLPPPKSIEPHFSRLPSATPLGLHVDLKTKRESTTTTPPDSPPPRVSTFVSQPMPVFNKPTLAPVFVPRQPAEQIAEPVARSKVFTALPSVPLPPRPPPLSTHSTLESYTSSLFDKDEAPGWLPSTQDTGITTEPNSQVQPIEILDEDDSWPLDERLAAGAQWTFGVNLDKDDSMTWSTLPSQSQRADTGKLTDNQTDDRQPRNDTVDHNMEVDERADEDKEFEEMIVNAKPTKQIPEPTRVPSSMSMASSSSAQSQIGLFAPVSKLQGSASTLAKKGNTEVKKVLQMAAVAAKKQQEESDKKAARLKEMDNRRQQAMQRKIDEEKRKLKEDEDRRKKERENQTKKQKVVPDSDKKGQDAKKLNSQLAANATKPTPKTALKQLTSTLQTMPQASTSKLGESKPSKLAKSVAKPVADDDDSQPAQLVQTQMAARAKAQLQAAKRAAEPVVPSESIELPDINSEYSDSEDEDRPRNFDPPSWAQSPELRHILQEQSTINPDDIFGAVRPLRMEEIFRTRTSRFRARTSSANWTGTDRLTMEEERDYARRMGYR